MDRDLKTAIIVVIAIFVASALLSVLIALWASSCMTEWDIDAPDIRVGGRALISTQEREPVRKDRMRTDITMRVAARAGAVQVRLCSPQPLAPQQIPEQADGPAYILSSPLQA